MVSRTSERRVNMNKIALRVEEVAEFLGLSKSTIWNITNPKSRHYIPRFPKPIKISNNATRWLASDIDNYVKEVAEQTKGKQA